MKFLKHNAEISILGDAYTVSHESLKMLKPNVHLDNGVARVFRSDFKADSHVDIAATFLRKLAKKHIASRAEEFAEVHGFSFNTIRIKDTRTRWGSCSSLGNLNFNWKLVLVPPPSLDYVVIHELAHLKVMNHSNTFWDLVESMMPDYKVHKKILKMHEKGLVS